MNEKILDEMYSHRAAQYSVAGGKKFLGQHREYVERILAADEEIYGYMWRRFVNDLYLFTSQRIAVVSPSEARKGFFGNITAVILTSFTWSNAQVLSVTYVPGNWLQEAELIVKTTGSSVGFRLRDGDKDWLKNLADKLQASI